MEKKQIGPYYIRWRPKLEGETENMGVCTKLCWKFAAVSGSTVRGDCFNAAIPAFMEEREGGWKCSNMEGIDLPLGKSMREKVGFTEKTAKRHRRGG